MSMTPEQAAEGWRAARISEVQHLLRGHGLTMMDVLESMVNEICQGLRESAPSFKEYEDTYMDGWLDGCNECNWAIIAAMVNQPTTAILPDERYKVSGS